MNEVWVVTYLDDLSYEVAALNELNESFEEDPEQFGVEEVGWAKANEIYGWL